MGPNLKARLLRIRDTERIIPNPDKSQKNSSVFPETTDQKTYGKNDESWPGWIEVGFKTLKRELYAEPSFSLPEAFPESLAILIPDFARMGHKLGGQRTGCVPSPNELLFFDLETSGLSGGAGTVAFLAAFGRFIPAEIACSWRLMITQYLLLDYSGEADFVERITAEFAPKKITPGAQILPPVVVSYNGKCFDSQILRNRCLMNGITPPDYFHADLLHPTRRLWKRTLPDCSQATIEISVLGLDRSGDVSGAMAPEIWFSFLKTGGNSDLLSVCDHNVRDIKGLASLFLCMEEIASDPFKSQKRFGFDIEALALAWRKAIFKGSLKFDDEESCRLCVKKGELLLKAAAEKGCPGAAIAAAIDAEWKIKNPAMALKFTLAALKNHEIPDTQRLDLEKRRSRLEKKISNKK